MGVLFKNGENMIVLAVRRVTSSGDWTFGRNRSNYASGTESIEQRVKTRLLCLKKNWFLDKGYGIRWLSYGDAGTNQAELDTEIKQTIANTNGIAAILNFNSFVLDREYKAEVTVRDVYGNTFKVSA